MKNSLMFGSLLWLRRLIFGLLVILVLLGLVLFFVVNSPLVIKKAADRFAGDYNISYDDIKGNALTGIEIENPRFKDEILAKKLQIKWNPNTLPAKKVSISKLHIEEANIAVIQDMIDSFSTENNTSTTDNNESGMDFTVNAKNVEISLAPFIEHNIAISKAYLKSDALSYAKDGVNIDHVIFELDTNVTHISLQGNMKKNHVTLKNVNLGDINISALMPLFVSKSNDTKEPDTAQEKETKNPFMPTMLRIETLKTNILPFEYAPLHIKQIALEASEMAYDIENNVMIGATLDLNGTTNLSNLFYKGSVHDNHLVGEINLKPNNRLYELYGIPLRKEAIANVIIDFNASTEGLVADVKAKGRNILVNKKGEFNIDVDDFISHVVYDFNTSHVQADTQAKVTTPYAKDILLSNKFIMDDNISYTGEAKVKQVIGFDEKLTKPLEDLHLEYSGNDKEIHTLLISKALKGSFDTQDFKTGQVHLETIDTLRLNEMIKLPEELKDAEVAVIADAPLDFSNLSNIDAKVKVTSNVLNVDADVGYGKEISVKGKVEIPQNSLVKAYSKDVKWEALSPLDTSINLGKEMLTLKLNAKVLGVDVDYELKQGSVKGKINLAGLVTTISGQAKEQLKVETKIRSMAALQKDISTLYTLEDLPPIEGNIDVNLLVTKLQSAELSLTSAKLIYKADRKTEHIIKDVKVVASLDASKVVLKSYQGTFNKQKYFSTKPALITLGDKIEISNLWVNDELKVEGNYQTKTKQGTFTADAQSFHIKDKVADIQTQIHLTTKLDGNNTTVNGNIVLLKGNITPDIEGRTFASDSDIIIIQEMKKVKKSPFMDNLTLALRVETKEALRLKQGPMNIQLSPDLTISKDKGSPILYLGSIELLKGGTYIFQEKKFVLAKSFIYFTGNVNKPLLDMKAKYKSIDYLITIAVTGTPAAPTINFSSTPSLTREQILSVILFDSEAGGDTHSGSDMMKMMGGAMAKSALADAGVQVDHLAFGEGNSVEVGKKLTDNVTVIYVNGDIPSVRLKYQHSQRTESVIEVNEESQSYDIIYKRDF